MTLPVHIKHAGKVYDVDLDTDLPASAFKDAIYQVTGVPPERMKVMIKGGVLKVCIASSRAITSYLRLIRSCTG
jgi:hypothetical protein